MTVKHDRIVRGDCITELERLEADCVDLAFADPPFNIGYEYDEYDDRRADEDYLAWSKRWMQGVIRVLRPWGAFWLAIGDEYAAELKGIASRELGLVCRNWVVWYYTFGVHCNSKFARSHAHLFYFLKPGPSYAGGPAMARRTQLPIADCQLPITKAPRKRGRGADPRIGNRQSAIGNRDNGDGVEYRTTFNDSAIRVPSARQLVYADRRANPKGRVPDDTWIIPPHPSPERERGADQSRDSHGAVSAGSAVRTADQSRDREGAGENCQLPIANCQMGPERTPIDNRQSAIGNSFVLRPQDLPSGFAADSDTWYFPRVCGTFKERRGFHGCQMPEQLLGRIIKACSNEGDLVLDPFAGSGTTLAVAKKLGRKYLGCEISNEYVTEANKRLAKIAPGDPLNGPENPLTSVPDTTNGKTRDTRVVCRSAKLDELSLGVLDAFRSVHEGPSTDWLLADPTVNARFTYACERRSLPGSPAEWNRTLIRLRKAGKLGPLQSVRRHDLDRDKIQECEFASEIALSQFWGISLDTILCEPELVAKFDGFASRLAPGFEPVYYRWAALQVRKKAKDTRQLAEQFAPRFADVRLRLLGPVRNIERRVLPQCEGVYVLGAPATQSRKQGSLYVGNTSDLRAWARRCLEAHTFEQHPFSIVGGMEVVLRFASRREATTQELPALQAYLVAKRAPVWNYSRLGLGAA